ncbi:hypothetical protein [Steroidobacter cummioxidans]|uniref:hypothetical protein n=1 Tax=Steroidobacter cummioxidans TaxID=1803913 RepID=UPI0012904CDF|nr:hypothetical protein [Steroidobacter cummioxidans]
MSDSARSLLKLEILICFAPCMLMLAVATIILPAELMRPSQESPAPLILVVSCGLFGLWSLLRVISALFDGNEMIENPRAVLTGVVFGAAPLLYQAILALSSTGETRWGIFTTTVGLPLLATAHILYLSRHLFIAGFEPPAGGGRRRSQ